MELHFNVNNQKLEQSDSDFIVNKSNNYLKLFFDIQTDDWIGLTWFVILKDDKRVAYQFNWNSEGVIVPFDVVKGKSFYVSLYGADSSTKRITTNELRIRLIQAGYTRDIHSITDIEKRYFC